MEEKNEMSLGQVLLNLNKKLAKELKTGVIDSLEISYKNNKKEELLKANEEINPESKQRKKEKRIKLVRKVYAGEAMVKMTKKELDRISEKYSKKLKKAIKEGKLTEFLDTEQKEIKV
jgi:hypothetical protein